MKYITTWVSLAWLGLLISSLSMAQSPTPVAANGQLKVINRQLSSQSGKAIQLRGMSSHGLQYFPNCFTASSVQTLARDWGIDVFRSAMYVDEGGYVTDKARYRAFIDNLVDWTGQNGVYNIIDWHILNPGNPNDHLTDAKEFFQIEAQKHAGKKHVIYEICNEPHDVDWNTIKGYAEQIIPIIRQYDSEAIILVGTPGYSGLPGDVRSNPLTGANVYNVMYTFHFYAGSHYTENYIDDVLKTVPLFISEWGTSNYSGNGGNDYANSQTWLNLLAGGNSSGIKVSWANWNFSDNSETSAALNPGSCNSGSWNNTSTSGTWVKDHILNPADDFGPATPSVTLTSPAANSTVIIGGNVVLTAAVSNTTATAVEFYSGTSKVGQATSSPYSFTISSIQAGTYSFTARALFSNGSPLTSPVVSVTAVPAPNQAPAITLTAPANGSRVPAPATFMLTANATDADGTIAKVAFYNGSTKLSESTTAPYQYSWAGVPAGTYMLTAQATDNQNAVTTSGAITVTVYDPNAPQGDIIGPDCAAKNAVQTYAVNSANLPNATSFSWWCTGSTQSITTPQPGQASINFGPSFTGGQVCVGINYAASPWYKQYCKDVALCTGNTPPPANQPPAVALTTPATGASLTAPATVTLSATASDTDGSVTKVEFFDGTTKLGESTVSPYQYTWNSVAAGTYTLTAKATDNAGASTGSATITITVNAATTPSTGSEDLNGPTTVAANSVKTYALSTGNLTSATSFSWWCTGSTRSISASNGQATIDYGPWFTGGDVCVGVNYSASPWYKQVCKTVKLSPSGNRSAAEPEAVLVYPNPTSTQFQFIPGQDVQALRVVDLRGLEQFSHGPVPKNQPMLFGDNFPTGHYLLHIQFVTDRQQTIKLIKNEK